MKLYHRTRFWGSEIKALKLKSEWHVPFPVIWTQAIANPDTNSMFRGCCRGHGDRCFEVNETHFLGGYRGNWNLYLVNIREGRTAGTSFYKFVLVPEHNKYFNGNCTTIFGWTHIGTIAACTARMDLAHSLSPFLNIGWDQNASVIRKHAHVGIMMDAIDTTHNPKNNPKKSIGKKSRELLQALQSCRNA